MIFFGHVGTTVGLVNGVQAIRYKTDYRVIALMSIGPDLIDKPAGLLFRSTFENNTRMFGHSVVCSLLVLAALAIWKKRQTGIELFAVWAAFAGHLLLDRMWRVTFSALAWPFAGEIPPRHPKIFAEWLQTLLSPVEFSFEVIGLAIIIGLIIRYQLHKKKFAFEFMRTGRLNPIDQARKENLLENV